MIEILTPDEVEGVARTGAFVGRVLAELQASVEPGLDLLEIDAQVDRWIGEAGAESCYREYAPSFGRGPFGHVICTSVNDAVLHGLPHAYRLRDGDLLTLDFAVSIDGWVADAAVSFTVGTAAQPGDAELIAATREALDAGIAQARPGNKIGDISAGIGAVLGGAGYRVNTQFGGHGVGRTMHQDPHVPNAGRAGRGLKLQPGLVLAIEPWVMVDTDELTIDADGWTLRSSTGARTAHSEHTVAITEDGPRILTLPA